MTTIETVHGRVRTIKEMRREFVFLHICHGYTRTAMIEETGFEVEVGSPCLYLLMFFLLQAEPPLAHLLCAMGKQCPRIDLRIILLSHLVFRHDSLVLHYLALFFLHAAGGITFCCLHHRLLFWLTYCDSRLRSRWRTCTCVCVCVCVCACVHTQFL